MNSDWVGNHDNHSSTTTYITFHGVHLVSWCSNKQKPIARSSTEAEYGAVATISNELNWIQNLLTELHLPSSTTPTIFCDNVGAIYRCATQLFHSRMKRISVDFHFLHDQVAGKNLRATHVHMSDELVDSPTKVLPHYQFQLNRSKNGIQN